MRNNEQTQRRWEVSYNICDICGGANGVVNRQIFQCACVQQQKIDLGLITDKQMPAQQGSASLRQLESEGPADELQNDDRAYGCYLCGAQGLKKGQRVRFVFCYPCHDVAHKLLNP